jgi:hypothetical protein
MATALTTRTPPRVAGGDAGVKRRPGFWLRLLTAIVESRSRAAERELARFVERSGRHADRLDRDP